MLTFAIRINSRAIGTVHISRMGGPTDGICKYEVEVTYPWSLRQVVWVDHDRRDGPLVLIHKALGALLANGAQV